MMMHAFGDVADPLLESAKLLELLVKKYVCCILDEVRAVLPPELLQSEPAKVFPSNSPQS